MAIITAEDYFIEGCKNLSVKHQKYSPFYQNSKGDDFKAKELFEKSANLGYAPAMRELGRCYIEGYGIWIKNKLAKGHALLCKAIFAGDKDALNYYWEKECEYRFANIKDENAVQNHREVQRLLLKKEEEEEAARKAKAKAKRQAKKEAERKKQEEAESKAKAKEIEVSQQTKTSKSDVHEKEGLDTDIIAVFEESESNKKSKKENKAQSKPKKKSATTTAKKTKSISESDDEDIDRKIDAIFEDKVEEVDDDTSKSKSKSSSQSQVKGSVKAKQSKKEVVREAKDEVEEGLKAKMEVANEAKDDVEHVTKEETETKSNAKEVSKEKTELENLKISAENNNPSSQYKLALLYKEGNRFIRENEDKYLYWLRKSAELDFIDAMVELGDFYLKDDLQWSMISYINKEDETEGLKWYKKAAKRRNLPAIKRLIEYYGSRNDKEETINWLKKAAELDDIDAILDLARTVHDKDLSAYWLNRAATLGSRDAMHELGEYYEHQSNLSEALRWYISAAELGHIHAMFITAVFFHLGCGTDVDIKEAAKWYEKVLMHKGEDNDDYWVDKARGNLFKLQNSTEWKQLLMIEQREAKALEDGAKAICRIGFNYQFGKENFPIDLGKAILWHTKSAELGYDIAMFLLGRIYSTEEEYKDYDKCFYWFKKSAELGFEHSQASLGRCYEFGLGTSIDLIEAIKWYEKANTEFSLKRIAEIKKSNEWKSVANEYSESNNVINNSVDAWKLGLNLLNGTNGYTKDIDKAKLWFQKSVEMDNSTASTFMSLQHPILDLASVVSPSYEPTNCEIKAPIGQKDNGETVEFNLDVDKHAHAFVIGKTGSGKSRFLHDIIISMISKYSPEDIELYLIDFKGIEFNPYRNIKHSRVVLVNRADEQITFEIINEINEKLDERRKLFGATDEVKLSEYNNNNKENHLPQILLIVDECQVLFEDRPDNPRLQDKMLKVIKRIATEGRASGVHLLMATQSLTNASQLGSGILNQISEHYILPCIPADAARLVPEHERRETETVVANMEIGKGQCYYQGENEKYLFTFNYIEKGESQTTLINLAKDKAERYKSNGQIYFSGSLQFSLTTEIVEWLSSKGRDNLVTSPGQSIDLKQEPLSLVLRNDMSENVMLLGLNDKHYVTHTAINILTSLIAVSEKKNVACKFYVFDCYDDDEADYFTTLDSLAQTGKCKIVSKRNRMNVLFELCKDIASNQAHEQKVLLILGEERFGELKNNSQLSKDVTLPSLEDALAMMIATTNNVLTKNVQNQDLSYIKNVGDALEFILSKGPDCGIFTIMQLDKIDHLYLKNDGYISIKNVDEWFKHFIIFRSNEKDLRVLGLPDDNIHPERLEDNSERLRAYYHNNGNGKYSLFTPYIPLTPEQIKKLL